MAQTIKCTQCGAVMKPATTVPAGKRVKCPKCNQVFTVEAEEQPNPFAVTGNVPPAGAPAAGDAAAGAKPKKGKGMMIGLIAGGALLLCCCCPLMGAGGWYGWGYFSGPSLQGGWIGKDDKMNSMLLMPGGRAYLSPTSTAPKQEELLSGNGAWKVDGKTLELTLNDTKSKVLWFDSDRAKFTFEIKGSVLNLTNTKDNKKFAFDKGEDKK